MREELQRTTNVTSFALQLEFKPSKNVGISVYTQLSVVTDSSYFRLICSLNLWAESKTYKSTAMSIHELQKFSVCSIPSPWP